MGKTVVEKILSRNADVDAHAGEIVMAQVDAAMSNDASGPLSIEIFHKMNAARVLFPERIALILDHYVPCPDSKVAHLQQSVLDFAQDYGIAVYRGGEGIAHQVFDERGYVRPGRLLVGGDSHATTYGYLNCLGIGMGSSDMAMVFQSGKLWFRVPETIRINFSGSLARGVGGKDVALWLIRLLGANGGNYRSLEFGGEGIGCLSMDDRRTICNMAAECCAKCAIMPLDALAQEDCHARGIDCSGAVTADPDCVYLETKCIDLSKLGPMIARPHSVADGVALEELAGMPVDMALIGTCTNGRLADFRAVHALLKQTSARFAVDTLVIPASREIALAMAREGISAALLERGAMLLPPGCGPCCGSSPGVPRDNATVISTANRNFLGRMGNVTARIYLASPVVAAAAALSGKIMDPKELMRNDSARGKGL